MQGYLSETYATLITEDNSDAKEQMKRRMTRYLQENRIAVDGMTASELVDALYTEMAEYGFLTKYIFADGIEEIDINSWRDIEIISPKNRNSAPPQWIWRSSCAAAVKSCFPLAEKNALPVTTA